MNPFPSTMTATVQFSSNRFIPEIPALKECSWFDSSATRMRLDQVDVVKVVEELAAAGYQIKTFNINVNFETAFWEQPPDDCCGGVLRADGFVSINDTRSKSEIVSLEEPFYIHGRPDSDTGMRGATPHVLGSRARGGIPLISERLLETLLKLGAEGETADIIYRGPNKKTYDTVLKGFKRFLAEPAYNFAEDLAFDVLPSCVPDDFNICSLKRTRRALEWYDIALSLAKAIELMRLRRTVLLSPIFRRDGQLHKWLQTAEQSIQNLVK